MSRRRYPIPLAFALALACGGPSPARRPAPPQPSPPSAPQAPTHERALPTLSIGGRAYQIGLATYYANRFTGHPTASGERYDPRAMTAAHPSLPFGALVRVTRVDDGGSPLGSPVVVRVNDRGPFAGHGRVIDLSLAAARRLGMMRAGVVRVRVEVVSLP
jgi:rare lipoprotein A